MSSVYQVQFVNGPPQIFFISIKNNKIVVVVLQSLSCCYAGALKSFKYNHTETFISMNPLQSVLNLFSEFKSATSTKELGTAL